MSNHQWHRLATLLVILIFSGCSQPAAQEFPAKEVTLTKQATIAIPSTEVTAVMVTDTAPAPAATETPAPTTPPVESTATNTPPISGVGISAENAKGLVELTVQLPNPPDHISWLGANVTNIPPAFSPRPQILVQSGPNVIPVTIGDKLSLGEPFPLPLNGTQVLAMAPDGSSLVIQDPSRTAAFGLDGKLVRELQGPNQGAVSGASYASSAQYLVLTTPDKIQAFVYHLTDTSTTRLEGFETAAPVYSAGISPDGRWLAWVSRATMQFQDVNAPNSAPGSRLSFTDFIGPWSFSPDSSKVALFVAGSLSVYSVPDAKELLSITTGQPVNALAWSPDGKLLAGGYGANLQIWDASTLAPVASLPGPNTFTGAVSFSPDGRYIYSIHDNSVLGVWEAK